MFILNSEINDPFFNLAVDEYLLKNKRQDFLVLTINSNSAIIGKHQVAHRETDTRFLHEHDIPVIRRISGGGTVFHDRGNLNFSFIKNSEQGKQVDFRKYTLPVINFLSSLGLDAKFEGKNDLKLGGYKISGNAEHVFRNRVLHHGTLLFDADIESLKWSIRKDTSHYSTRAVNSNPSMVMNLKKVLPDVGSAGEFSNLMIRWMLDNHPGSQLFALSAEEEEKTAELARSKYRGWDWNYGYGPEYQFRSSFSFEEKEISVRLYVKDGIILDSAFEGPYEISLAGKEFIGCRHMPDALLQVIKKKDLFPVDFDVFNLF